MKTPSIKEIAALFRSLKKTIADDYRASDDADDKTPGMSVTVGASVDGSWNYQTGDNSYTGGAYGHPFWGVISLYKNSNCRELAIDCVYQIAESMSS